MPRKTGARGRGLEERSPGFNEAAARCRGKRAGDHALPRRLAAPRASMRPRPDAAENRHLLRVLRPGSLASMRPRPDAAENPGAFARDGRRGAASMRPRPDAAENELQAAALRVRHGASMRPRPDAAENTRCRRRPRSGPARRFNEAAARCRGKPFGDFAAAESAAALQ